jgi:NAD(P)H-dependent nitrite reductase small subunit
LNATAWVRVAAWEDIYPDSGACALVSGKQVAVFRVGDAVHAIGNLDPFSGVNVLSRGIVGDLDGELVVASPLFKQHFSLLTGRCLEEPERGVPVYPARVSDGYIWLQGESVVQSTAVAKRRLVVIGNGPAAMRTIEELMELAPKGYEITIFGAEPHHTYNRILLSSVLAGEKTTEDIVTHPPQWFADQGITLHLGDPVVRIDRAKRCVHGQSGITCSYDRLLIATGSAPLVLTVPGKTLPGVLTFRDLQDVDAMVQMAKPDRPAVVIGGGLLGLEAAIGLAQHGMKVTVVHLSAVLMNRQLDAHAGELLRAELEGRGVKFCMSAKTTAVLGTERVTALQLADGRELPAHLVVMATGVRPNIELAKAAGLRTDRGILVDDTLQTFDPSVYAVGECVQHRNSTYGLVAPLWEQARVCAAHLAERGVRRYGGSRVSTKLKVTGIQVFSAGDFSEDSGAESLVLRDPKRGIYKRLFIDQDRIRGAVLYGDTRDGSWYFDLINEGRDIGSMRDQLLFGEAAAALGVAQ